MVRRRAPPWLKGTPLIKPGNIPRVPAPNFPFAVSPLVGVDDLASFDVLYVASTPINACA